MQDKIKHIEETYSKYIAMSRYARYNDDLKRRETWEETVDRLCSFWRDRYPLLFPYEEVKKAITNLEIMPSMRSLMTAGKALDRDEVSGYNCAYIAINDTKCFDEFMYCLMCGTGVGFSVERQEINKLPTIAEELFESDTIIKVKDSKIGWCSALRELISLLYIGKIPKWDLSSLRPAGARLKTFGGRSSGPGPLNDVFTFIVALFKRASGRQLTSLECHDICCKIAECVVVGGVRRCLPKDSRVITTNGYKTIENINIGDHIVCENKTAKVLDKVNSGIQKTLKIIHRFGEFECTPNHRVAIFNKVDSYIFKEASELKEGDRLVWDGYGIDGSLQELPKLDYAGHFNAKQVTIPQYLNVNIAWLIGLIQGDGSIQPKAIEISSNKDEWETLEKANSIFQSEFGVSGRIDFDSHMGNGIRLRISSVALASWFHAYIKQSNTSLKIPSFVFGSSKENRFAYLMGVLDSDGRVREDGVIDQAATVYESFKDDLVTLGATLGIALTTSFYSNNDKRMNGGLNKDYWSIRVVGNENRKTFYENSQESMKLNGKILSFNSPVDFSWPTSILERRGNKNSVTAGLAIKENYQKTKLMPLQILSIEEGREIETFDIEIENIHQFTTNGIIVHNSATISLSNVSDDRMRDAKAGQWWIDNVQRALANNSAAYTEKPEISVFMKEWISLYNSKSGERGIFNRVAAKKKAKETGRRDPNYPFGGNPCLEILLKSMQFCNLSEVIIRENDDFNILKRKIELATILGTFQSTLTNFRYLRSAWKKNCEEERLLGVSLTGIMDNKLTSTPSNELQLLLTELKQIVIDTNKKWAALLNINPSVASTAVKPSGTVSQLVNSSSGIHPRYSKHYIRTIRADKTDPLALFLMIQGIPCEDDITKPMNTYVFSFPMKSPNNAIVSTDLTALQQLEMYMIYQKYWSEHNVSITVYIREHEWLDVAAWVYKNFDDIGGISFLPYSDHAYKQAPYQPITEDQYVKAVEAFPNVNWEQFIESEDTTKGSQELACVGGNCEI